MGSFIRPRIRRLGLLLDKPHMHITRETLLHFRPSHIHLEGIKGREKAVVEVEIEVEV